MLGVERARGLVRKSAAPVFVVCVNVCLLLFFAGLEHTVVEVLAGWWFLLVYLRFVSACFFVKTTRFLLWRGIRVVQFVQLVKDRRDLLQLLHSRLLLYLLDVKCKLLFLVVFCVVFLIVQLFRADNELLDWRDFSGQVAGVRNLNRNIREICEHYR